MMILYSYVITRDYGFAPNPFPPYCTLATCKPGIRRNAKIGDWIVGVGSAAQKSKVKNCLVYAMQIEEKIKFDEYWNDLRFAYKKPIMNGSKKYLYGDNIYHFDVTSNSFVQENSHHSHKDGSTNFKNQDRDLSGEYVLISKKYWFFGEKGILIPLELEEIIMKGRQYKKITSDELIKKFISWLLEQGKYGYIGKPLLFKRDFERYNGIS